MFECVQCGHIQSQQSFMDNFGMTEEEASGYAHFSCEGRWFKKKKKSKKWGCDWSLGGLFSIHKLALDFENGKPPTPCFELASLKEARKHRKELFEKALKKEKEKL
ncbi:unnamed protein product [marine sediment metagenome]|uniref:Uncharacterized protein n=1 Tax=marine sediment metagenome TaxID=412755 RepID=X0WJ64_9ZZZZ